MRAELRPLRARVSDAGDHTLPGPACGARPRPLPFLLRRPAWRSVRQRPSLGRAITAGRQPPRIHSAGGPALEEVRLAKALDEKLRRLFGRSLRLRQVSAGGCNACEADTNVLGTIGWDLGRFGIQFVASPVMPMDCSSPARFEGHGSRPAKDLRRGGSSQNRDRGRACAIAGGPFVGHPQINQGVGGMLPIDLFIPGCPPHPLTTSMACCACSAASTRTPEPSPEQAYSCPGLDHDPAGLPLGHDAQQGAQPMARHTRRNTGHPALNGLLDVLNVELIA